MIIELVVTPIFLFIEFVISMLPDAMELPGWLQDTANLIGKAMLFFPPDVWMIVIANIIFWHVALIAWAIIEWLYKKIPTID